MDLTIRRSIDELPVIVAATGRFFDQRRIDPSVRLPVDLAIEELFVNMVTYNHDTDRGIRLHLEWTGDALAVSLTDYDVDPFDPTHVPDLDVGAPLDARQPRGMGLYLVSKMVDSIHYEYRDRESKVTFTKKAVADHA